MSLINWARAVSDGVVTQEQADLYRECLFAFPGGAWAYNVVTLSDEQINDLERIVHWFDAIGGVQ